MVWAQATVFLNLLYDATSQNFSMFEWKKQQFIKKVLCFHAFREQYVVEK